LTVGGGARMKRAVIIGSTVGIIVAGFIAAIGGASIGADEEYLFLVRGKVIEVDPEAQLVSVYVNRASSRASKQLDGMVNQFDISGAEYVERRRNREMMVKGDTVVMKGVKTSSGVMKAFTVSVDDELK